MSDSKFSKKSIDAYSQGTGTSIILTDLKTCSLERDMVWGRRIHARIVERNECNPYVSTSLIRMYAMCGSMEDSHRVFDYILTPNVVSWTCLIRGYADNGEWHSALHMFVRMKEDGYAPDSICYVAALKACTSLAVNEGIAKEDYLRLGRDIHEEIGCHLDHHLQNLLIDMYGKCGSMVEARCIFDNMRSPDLVSWNALLMGYAENGETKVTLRLFTTMKLAGWFPGPVAFLAAIKACTSLAVNVDAREHYLEFGRKIHSEIGCRMDHYLQKSLIEMYAKYGCMTEARKVFDSIHKPDVLDWNALLLGYAENGKGSAALEMFSRMKADGVSPNSVTYVASLMSCTSTFINTTFNEKVNSLERGRQIHSEAGWCLNSYVQNTLIDMYSKCGSIHEARQVFDNIENPDVVSWNALLLGYIECGEGRIVLDLVSRMKNSGCIPSSVTYLAALKACGMVGALGLGRKFHSEINEFNPQIVSCLVDFYAKCGSMTEAREVFDLYPEARYVRTYNALLAGYGRFGDLISVFRLLEEMRKEGIQPVAVTFVCVLLCCSHAGLVENAREYFYAMSTKYGVTHTVVHYTCMVDVLSRANQLNEAIGLLQKMPCRCDSVPWMALLGASRKWKNLEIGRLAFQSVVFLDEKDAAAALVLMTHIQNMAVKNLKRSRQCLNLPNKYTNSHALATVF